MLELASITDPLVNVATDAVDAIGLPGVFLLMLLESACIPIPSEATMLFTGFNVSKGHYTLLEAAAAGEGGLPRLAEARPRLRELRKLGPPGENGATRREP